MQRQTRVGASSKEETIQVLPWPHPQGERRCLLALAGQYKPPTWTSLIGRDQTPPETGIAFQSSEVVMDPQVLDLLRLYSLRTVKLTFTSFNQQLCIHSHSEVITMLPFSKVPRSLYLMLTSWELQGGDQSPTY